VHVFREIEFTDDVLQPCDASLKRLHEEHLQVGASERQRDPGEPSAAAQVDNT
jgi:hypothetical protein